MAAPRYLLVRLGRLVAEICRSNGTMIGSYDCRNFRNGPLLLGECIPAETGAAPVHRSRWIAFALITFFGDVLSVPVVRLDCGPQWKDFLNFAEYSNPEGVSLQESDPDPPRMDRSGTAHCGAGSLDVPLLPEHLPATHWATLWP